MSQISSVIKRPAVPKSRTWRQVNYHLSALLFIAPWLIGFLLFLAYPFIESLRLSFTDFKLLDPESNFIGLKNYIFMFTRDKTFKRAALNSLQYAIMQVPLSLMVSLSIAILLNQKVRGMSFWRTAFFLPSLVPPVATIVVFRALFDPGRGLINAVLGKFGLPQPGWFASTDTALLTMVIMGAWGFGGTMIIMLAGLQDVPRSLLEAAEIDGANSWQRFWAVTIPLISPVIFFNLVLGCIGALQVFAQSIILGGATGWPGGSTLFYNVYVYVVGFNSPYRMGYASALGWTLFLGVLVVTGLNFLISKRYVFYSGEGEMTAVTVRASLRPKISPRRALSQAITYILLLMVGIVVVMPFLWLIGNSFRTFENVLRDITRVWPESFYLGNWPESLSKFPFFLYLRNSLIITVVPMFTSITASAIVAFGFTRFRARWLNLMFGLMLATMMVPGQIITIPLYVWYTKLKWIDTFAPFLVPALFAGAFDVFLLRQFFLTVPRDLADAATMDGASNLLIFRHVYVPLSSAPIAALVVLQFLGRWNDYYNPSVYMQSQDHYVLQQGLTYLMGVYGANLGTGHDTMNMVPWNLLSAASILVTIPIIVLFFMAQKQFIEGIRFTGLKG